MKANKLELLCKKTLKNACTCIQLYIKMIETGS